MNELLFYDKKWIRKNIIFIGSCILMSLILLFLSRNTEGFAEWYATYIYPVFPNSIGRLFSVLPFSIFEAGICFFILMTTFYILKVLWLAVSKHGNWKRYFVKGMMMLLSILSSFLLLYTLTSAINYDREALSNQIGLPMEKSSKEELVSLSMILIDDLSGLAANEGISESNNAIDQAAIRQEAVEAMQTLGKKYPSLSGYYPNPKPVVFSKAMSYLGIDGIYSPFSLEANYNDDILPANIPYTICHELAHLKGYMREDEAGFWAFLACRNSSSVQLQYSGEINALAFVLNQLQYETSQEEFLSIYHQIPERVRMDLTFNQRYAENHSSDLTAIVRKVNNLYLIANAQSEGIKSYGLMVDLLLAEYADRIRTDAETL